MIDLVREVIRESVSSAAREALQGLVPEYLESIGDVRVTLFTDLEAGEGAVCPET